MGRSELRERVFKLLFRIEFHTEGEMVEQEEIYREECRLSGIANPEDILDRYRAVAGRKDEIDSVINGAAKGWKTSRMSKVDLTVLRLAVYEIFWDDEVPMRVAINEAVELAKKYSGGNGPAFVNGVLANVVKRELKDA